MKKLHITKKPPRFDFNTGTLMRVTVIFFALVSLCSCMGVNADITVRGDGSGKMILEYRVSRMAEALGRLDGNERWQTVPLGRADFERTMTRLPNLRLVSFSSKSDDKDIINKAELEFQNIEDLLAFFDPAAEGKYASFAGENGRNRLSLLLWEGAPEIDADLLSLIQETSAGYAISFSLSVPGTASLALTDKEGRSAAAPPEKSVLISPGKKVSLSVDTAELFAVSGGLGMEFEW
ncbi:MAG TPA: hypothetical protein DEQ14_00040 [Treponema sp.]|nr:hypothetical protein [Treponema sp.]